MGSAFHTYNLDPRTPSTSIFGLATCEAICDWRCAPMKCVIRIHRATLVSSGASVWSRCGTVAFVDLERSMQHPRTRVDRKGRDHIRETVSCETMSADELHVVQFGRSHALCDESLTRSTDYLLWNCHAYMASLLPCYCAHVARAARPRSCSTSVCCILYAAPRRP